MMSQKMVLRYNPLLNLIGMIFRGREKVSESNTLITSIGGRSEKIIHFSRF